MSDGIERDPEKRCKSSDVERAGRTHYCKRTDHFTGDHECICHRTWGEAVAS